MRIRLKNKKTGTEYKFVDPLLYVAGLYRCTKFNGKKEFVQEVNLTRR